MLEMGTTYRAAARRQCSPGMGVSQCFMQQQKVPTIAGITDQACLQLLVCIQIRDGLLRPRQLLKAAAQVPVARARALETPRCFNDALLTHETSGAHKQVPGRPHKGINLRHGRTFRARHNHRCVID